MASALETLAGQAFGAKQYPMLGIYLQRSWIVLLLSAALLVPMYVFAAPLLAAMGQPAEVARLAGELGLCMLPMHFLFALLLPINKFLQSQGKNWVMAATALASFPVHVAATWLLVVRFRFGVLGAAMALNVSWGLSVVVQLAYVVGGGCPLTWTGFSPLAFADLCGFIKLSLSSGVMVWYVWVHHQYILLATNAGALQGPSCMSSYLHLACSLENSYYKVLLLLTGHLKNSQLAVDALSIW